MSVESKDVLCDILKVLERIEARLDRHEERLRTPDELEKLPRTLQDQDQFDGTTDTLADSTLNGSRLLGPSRRTTAGIGQDEVDEKHGPRIPYGGWSVDQFIRALPREVYNEWGTSHTHLDRFYSLTTLSPDLERKLGSCWDMPDDGRLPLKFFKSNILKMHMSGGGPTFEGLSKTKIRMEEELSALCHFDEALRNHPGNDFAVVDFDRSNNTRMYRLGQSAIGSELMVDASDSEISPWSRLILYQGATTGGSIDTGKKRPEQPIPYFTRTDRIIGVWDHLSCHLQLKRRPTTTNPYSSRWTGFHTTFYEIMKTEETEVPELWQHGPLYEHPFNWQFRKCALTLYSPAAYDLEANRAANRAGIDDGPADTFQRYWTLLVLAPSGFYNEHSTLFPSRTAEVGPGMFHVSTDPLGKLTQPGAEMKFIGQGLEKISERWADFQAYFDYILDSGNSLMHPAEHDNLLFDDGAFSRSRRYFWAIDCLSEFELSISDNLHQWELYKQARVDPLGDCLPDLDQRQLIHVERQYRVLQNQRESFRQKLASIRALRDALFNASTVIESRASTRLGENVKLLTFVSIFFLPLAFTTSLWSINDKFSTTILIYVIVIVALLTYFIMFNINSLAQGFGNLYAMKKKGIVRAMKSDPSEEWKHRGQRFEVFRPKHERPEPSEWYIPVYAALHPTTILGFAGASDTRGPLPSPARSGRSGGLWAGLTHSFRSRRRPAAETMGRTDEGWVL